MTGNSGFVPVLGRLPNIITVNAQCKQMALPWTCEGPVGLPGFRHEADSKMIKREEN